MHFEERSAGDYRIFAGALESALGDGHTAAVIVNRWRGLRMVRVAVLLRLGSFACSSIAPFAAG